MADTSSVSAIVSNGVITNLDSSSSTSSTSSTSGYDKDAFMKILVAQMKYQDPLEPTSNTEYISQYATFTQVEQLSNMANAMSLSRASEMVGKTVKVTQTNESGTTSEIIGTVDYVTYSGSKAYISIDGTNYNVDDVTQVYDSDYTDAQAVVADFQEAIDKLPSSLDFVTDEEYGLTIDTMYEFYMTQMSDKAKNMMDSNYVTSLLQYVNRIDELRGNEYRNLTTYTTSETTSE